jgi:nucleoside recognition membrane protein YjiH
MVGGFIILFSVIVQLLHLIQVSVLAGKLFEGIFCLIDIPVSLGVPFFAGLFEITLGATLLSEIQTDSLLPKVILVSFILGFNGFSIQAQVASILAKTDIRFRPYFFARLLHGIIASILTILFYQPLYLNRVTESDVAASGGASMTLPESILYQMSVFGPWLSASFLAIACIVLYRKKTRDG